MPNALHTPSTPNKARRLRRRGQLNMHTRPPHAFALMELIVVVLLLVGFMTLITSLFVTAYRAQVDSVKRDNLLHRVDSAIGTLRRDVWGARRMAFADGHLDLTISDKKQVRWETNEPHRLTRKQTGDTPDAQSTQTWIDLPDVDNVNVHGPLVTLTFKEARQRESLTLVSELLIGVEK